MHACQFLGPRPRAPSFEAALGSVAAVALLPPSGERALASSRYLFFPLPRFCCCIRHTFSQFSSPVLVVSPSGTSSCRLNEKRTRVGRCTAILRAVLPFSLWCCFQCLRHLHVESFVVNKTNPKIFLKHKKI